MRERDMLHRLDSSDNIAQPAGAVEYSNCFSVEE